MKNHSPIVLCISLISLIIESKYSRINSIQCNSDRKLKILVSYEAISCQIGWFMVMELENKILIEWPN